jgi:hypothetical protein
MIWCVLVLLCWAAVLALAVIINVATASLLFLRRRTGQSCVGAQQLIAQ